MVPGKVHSACIQWVCDDGVKMQVHSVCVGLGSFRGKLRVGSGVLGEFFFGFVKGLIEFVKVIDFFVDDCNMCWIR